MPICHLFSKFQHLSFKSQIIALEYFSIFPQLCSLSFIGTCPLLCVPLHESDQLASSFSHIGFNLARFNVFAKFSGDSECD